ncbi:TetR/AcrR family transcriptional regulator [Streptomyces sclerotialus]|uniref:TetR/AcrR family transcriptional regulator n=1 Tax=Streptomyces sclerotialus TaxID=1957 RepID=UPI0006898FC9
MPRDGYHHGDLRNALLAATMELVRERGARGFSVAEAARRAGVSSAAPYRHFPDRDAMLAAAARAGFLALEQRCAGLDLEPGLAARAAQIAAAYVVFAQEDPARFEVMFAAGLDKSAHPELLRQTERVQALLKAALAPFTNEELPAERAAELWSIAHGVAALAVGGGLGHVVRETRPEAVAARAAHSWATGFAG